MGECIDGNVDEDKDVVDPDVLADVEPEDIEREAKILQAAKHVVMARAQQKLFQQEIKQARLDSANEIIEQSRQSHVFVGDYCQKLELPSFCSQQPGDTYYLSPLTVNCFGAVDCGLEKDHLYAYVYHEGEGKCGGNNVVLLVLETRKACSTRTIHQARS
jgi:hypothetical protein